MSEADKTKISFHPPTFQAYETPQGWLQHDAACHALFYYYLIARRNFEEHIKDPIVYEGDADPEVNFKQLFSSIAIAYGVQPEKMLRFWSNIDLQCGVLKLPKLPEEYRFNKVPEIRSQ